MEARVARSESRIRRGRLTAGILTTGVGNKLTNECYAKLAGVSYDAFSMMRNTGGGRVSTRRRALGDTKKKKEGKKKEKKRTVDLPSMQK